MIKNNYKSNDKHPLSSFWSNSHKITKNRLNFFGKGITCIDTIHSIDTNMMRAVKEIDLSHNALNKLENMKQFRYIEVLNISHNHITDGKQLSKLKHLKDLKTIMVKGNPFLKSNQNIVYALYALIPLNSDIQTLNSYSDNLFCQALKKFTILKVKQQYNRQIQTNISLNRQFNMHVGEAGINNFSLYRRIITQKIEKTVEQIENRKQVFQKIMKIEMENSQQYMHFQNKKQLFETFDKNVTIFIEKVDSEIFEVNKNIAQKQDIYINIVKKALSKQKKELQKSSKKQQIMMQSPKHSILFDTSNKKWQNRQIQLFTDEKPEVIKKSKSPYKNQNYICQQEPSQIPQNTSTIIPQQKFQSYYYNMMMKHNPVYHLLYSPLQSLKNKQKDMLIQALSSHLKQKTRALIKAEKAKGDFAQMKKKYEALDIQFMQAQKTFLEYKESMSKKDELLRAQNLQKQILIQDLKKRLNFFVQKNDALQEKLSKLNQNLSEKRLTQIQNNHKLQKASKQDQIYQTIQLNRQKRLKYQILHKIQKKATILSKYRLSKEKINKKKQKNLIKLCFQGLKYEAKFSKFSKTYINNSLTFKKKQSMKIFTFNTSYDIKTKKVHNLYKNMKAKQILCVLLQKKMEKHQKQTKITNMRSKVQKNCMKNCFKDWKILVQIVKDMDLEQKAHNWHLQKLKKNVVKSWLIFVKQPVYKQAEIAVDLKTKNIRHFLFRIQSNFFDNKEIQLKNLNLSLFLNENKKIKGYFTFKTHILQLKQLRQNKQKRVIRELKAKYFYQFAICAQAVKQERQTYDKKIQQIQIATKSKLFSNMKGISYINKFNKNKLSQILWKYRDVCRKQSIKKSLKQFILTDKIKFMKIKQVFQNLNADMNRKLRINNKRKTLQLYLNCNKNRKARDFHNKKQFINTLWSPIKDRKKLRDYLGNKYLRTMMKYFQHWRINMHQEQIQMLKFRIRQFGPEIDQITRRQRATFEEKLVLMEVIESKQRTIKNYMKQLQQAEYKVKTKEDKYMKLKEYCQQQNNDHIFNSKFHQTTFMGQSRVPEHDYDSPFYEEDRELFKTFKHF